MTLSIGMYAGLIFIGSLSGGLLPLFMRWKSPETLQLFVSFGAGVVLSMAMLHMIPEAVELLGPSFGVWFLLGFVILLVLERFVMVHACEESGCHYHTVGLAAFAGLTIHGLIEGIALGSTLLGTGLGFLVFLAIISHKTPAGIALTTLMKLAGKSSRTIVLFAMGVSLSGPLGLFLSVGFIQASGYKSLAGPLLAMSAGTFLYIGACDLLPELHKSGRERWYRLFSFFLGIAISVAGGQWVHSHH